MLGTQGTREPYSRNNIFGHHDYPIGKINGLYRAEKCSVPEVVSICEKNTKANYSYDEVYGTYCHINEYINAPFDRVFDYAANIYSLEEWTYSVRDLQHIGGGVYKGQELLAPPTEIFFNMYSHKESGVVDYFCAWDQKNELWMRYYIRFIDARQAMNKPGTIMWWINCHHPYYDRNSKNPSWLTQSQNQQGRTWVGDQWKYFYAAHKLESQNFKNIVEARFNNVK